MAGLDRVGPAVLAHEPATDTGSHEPDGAVVVSALGMKAAVEHHVAAGLQVVSDQSRAFRVADRGVGEVELSTDHGTREADRAKRATSLGPKAPVEEDPAPGVQVVGVHHRSVGACVAQVAAGEVEHRSDVRTAEVDRALGTVAGEPGADQQQAALDVRLANYHVRAHQPGKIHSRQTAAGKPDCFGGMTVKQAQRQPGLDLSQIEFASQARTAQPDTTWIGPAVTGPVEPIKQKLPHQTATHRAIRPPTGHGLRADLLARRDEIEPLAADDRLDQATLDFRELTQGHVAHPGQPTALQNMHRQIPTHAPSRTVLDSGIQQAQNSCMDAQQAISVSGLRIRRGGRDVVRDLTFEVPRGTVTGLLGPSGCGKTSLLRAIVGVQIVAAGSVTVLGRPAGSAPLRRRVGYATQTPAVYADLTVTECVRFFASILRAPPSDVDRVISEVGLDPHARSMIGQLSGGELGRTNLAVALLGSPELLVLDEPTVGLDPVLREDLWQLFHRLAATGSTLLVSSHVMDEAARCDRLLLMRAGQLLADESPDELCQEAGTADLERAFLNLARREAVSNR